MSKLIAGRPKDLSFAAALIRERLIEPEVIRARLALVDELHTSAAHRLERWLARHQTGAASAAWSTMAGHGSFRPQDVADTQPGGALPRWRGEQVRD